MSGQRCKVLILDWDEDTLVSLQQVLEDAGVDTTITWDEVEARKLIKDKPFDLVLVGDHPPELTPETILRDSNPDLISCPCLLLHTDSCDSEHYRQLGFVGVAPKRTPFKVLGEVRKHWRTRRPDTKLTAARWGECPPTASSSTSIGQAA